jgi:hypothetical protein
MAMLDEHHLTETEGLYWAASGVNVTYTLGARYACNSTEFTTTQDATQVSWNCDPDYADVLKINVTGDFINGFDPIWSQLDVEPEWDQLVFTGGLLNRQRSLLYPFILTRTRACPSLPALPGIPPSPPAPDVVMRRLVVPAPIDLAAVERQAREELTPELDSRILLEPELQAFESLDFPLDVHVVGLDFRRLLDELEKHVPALPTGDDVFRNLLPAHLLQP